MKEFLRAFYAPRLMLRWDPRKGADLEREMAIVVSEDVLG